MAKDTVDVGSGGEGVVGCCWWVLWVD